MRDAEAFKGVADVVVVEHSFKDFFELEQDRLLRLLWMVTGSLQEAEDIMQDAFLRVWERWHKVSSMESPTGYTVSPDGSNRIKVFDSNGCDMGDMGFVAMLSRSGSPMERRSLTTTAASG